MSDLGLLQEGIEREFPAISTFIDPFRATIILHQEETPGSAPKNAWSTLTAIMKTRVNMTSAGAGGKGIMAGAYSRQTAATAIGKRT